ncbi:hypothetical protein GCM10022419_135170 [Nonomuraea rosea]|uniref:Uncharacterized protein n=1 Tax=Nonomuraea rosea TaxID=638574 RepID=A0ABP7A7Y9_9ACTN
MTLAAEQQKREQAVTTAAVAEQAREAASQARADAAGEAERLRAELTHVTSTLRTAQQQREEALTAAAVAQALLHEQETSRLPGHVNSVAGHPVPATDANVPARTSSDRTPTAAGPTPDEASAAGHS